MSNLWFLTSLSFINMSVLDKDIIKSEILPYLQTYSHGRPLPPSKLIGIVQLILYRLKTGCQWRELPIKQYLDIPYNWRSVYHHFNKWCKDGSWRRAWTQQVKENHAQLDLSSAQMDGTQTLVKRGGEATGYQKRKSSVTTNMLCISDRQGVLLAASRPEKGNQNDVFDIEKHFNDLLNMLHDADIRTNGLFLNADAGFDTKKLRSLCYENDIIPNFHLNPRNGTKADRDAYFDPKLYKHRTVIEHAFAWMDAFKSLLIRFETSSRNWLNLNIIGFMIIFARKRQSSF